MGVNSIAPEMPKPALLIITSILPACEITASIARWQAFGSVTSVGMWYMPGFPASRRLSS